MHFMESFGGSFFWVLDMSFPLCLQILVLFNIFPMGIWPKTHLSGSGHLLCWCEICYKLVSLKLLLHPYLHPGGSKFKFCSNKEI